MAWVPYDKYKQTLLDQTYGTVDHNADTFKIMLLTNAYTPDRTNHVYVSDVSINEVSGTNYARITLTSPTVTVASNTVTWDATEPATPHWAQSASGFSNARYAVLFKQGTADTDSLLIAYHDFTTDKGNTTGDLSIELDAAGIATL